MLRTFLMPDRAFASRERALLERLAVGLADEGVRVIQGVPGIGLDADDLRHEGLGVFTTTVPFADHGLPLTTRLRAGVLRESISRAIAGTRIVAAGVDILHVFGAPQWDLALETVRGTDARVIIELFSAACLDHAARRWPSWGSDPRVWWNAADNAIADALTATLGHHPRLLVNPWGVHVPDQPHTDISLQHAATIILWLGSGDIHPDSLLPALDALARRAKHERGLVILAHHDAAHTINLWKLARDHGLAESLSIVPELTERWDLTLRADALLIPAPTGEVNGFVLDAMAAGMPVIAHDDAKLSYLNDRTIARTVTGDWHAALADVLDNPDAARSIGASARHHIREHHLASHWTQRITAAYERIARREPSPR